MNNEQALGPILTAGTIESVLLDGDLSKLTTEQRVSYYAKVCQSLGLNPLTKPFDYIRLNNKLTLYAKHDCTDQLRKRDGVSLAITSRELIGDIYVVTAQASTRDGREDESTGAVSIKGLVGESLANAYMKAETKAKRRATLSVCGMGILDESEADGAMAEITQAQEIRTPERRPAKIQEAPQTAQAPPRNDDPITEKQGKRFFAIYKNAGWTDDDIKDWLLRDYGIEHRDRIPRSKYEEICTILESGARPEPGSDG